MESENYLDDKQTALLHLRALKNEMIKINRASGFISQAYIIERLEKIESLLLKK